MNQPTLQTVRLILRPFNLSDAPEVQRLAGHRDVAAKTLLIPHPYPDGAAEEWIATHPAALERGESMVFAIVLKETGALCGAMGLELKAQHQRAEIGYWIGTEYWGMGICTEAGMAVLKRGFETLGLHRIYAGHFGSNPASGRVLQKLGMKYEGVLRHHYLKWGQFEDAVMYGITVGDWEPRERETENG